MRATLNLLALLVAVSAAGQTPTSATYVTSEDIQSNLNVRQHVAVNPVPNLRVVDAGGYNVAVGILYRQKPIGHAAAHFKVSEVYHVIDGAATLVTGGRIVDAKTRSADALDVRLENGPSAEGTAIEGGESRRIKTGDIVIIPAGVPHQFTKVEGSITYIVVRVDPTRVLPPK